MQNGEDVSIFFLRGGTDEANQLDGSVKTKSNEIKNFSPIGQSYYLIR